MSVTLVYINKDKHFNMTDSFDITSTSSVDLDKAFNTVALPIPTFVDSFDIIEKIEETGLASVPSCEDRIVACNLVLQNMQNISDVRDIENTKKLIEHILNKSKDGFQVVLVLG